MRRTIPPCDRRAFAHPSLNKLVMSALLLVLAACSGKPTLRPTAVDLAVTGHAITKVRTAGSVVVLLEERLTSIFEDGPVRTFSILQSNGHTLHSYSTPSGWSVVDFALHPSGDISAILTTATEVRIVRLDSRGAVRSDQQFLDTAAATDPYFNYGGGIKNDGALQPVLMHDAARLVPLGESLAVVLRTGRNAIVAYRLDPDSSGAYTRSWRTLVEPGSSIFLVGIISGSFDVFGQLQNHVSIFVDADSNTLAVAVVNSPQRNFTFRAHSEFFHEPIADSSGVLLSRVAIASGERMGSTAVQTRNLSELHGLRATPGGFLLVGRVLTEVRPNGSGWDAFVATVKQDGSTGSYSVVDVNEGDILFDVAPLPNGKYLGLGSTGYTQNPFGASISESAQPLLVLLNSDGSMAKDLNYIGGPRQNQLTTVTPLNGRWLLGGMVNGPGTHSGDADHNLIVADGFLREDHNSPLD